MKKTAMLLTLALLPASGAFAEETPPEQPGVGTNIIGTQEAPTVLNVVPWKDKEVKLEKKDPGSSLLDRVLEPLDQEVLLREIEYYRILNQESGGEDLFLE